MNTEQLTPNQKRYGKAMEWMKFISKVGAFQIVIQGLTLLTGLIVIRKLSQNSESEATLYFIANNMLSTMVILADGGITNGVMSLGAQASTDKVQLGKILVTGLDLRKKFAIGSTIIALPITIYLLMKNGNSFGTTMLMFASILPMFYLSLAGNLLEIVARIKQDLVPLQTIRTKNNVFRLILTLSFIFIFPLAYIAIIVTSIPQYFANRALKKNADQYADFTQKPDPKIRKDILKVVAKILPGAAYYSISGQISIYLLTIFSDNSNQAIAEIGGLEKLSLALAVITSLFATIVTPRFAAIVNNKQLLLNRFVQIFILLIGVSGGIIFMFWLLDDFLLKILGDKYIGLNYELLLCIISACLGMIAGNVYGLFTNRGWNIFPVISIALSIAIYIIGGFIFKIGTLVGILHFNIFVNVLNLVINAGFMLYKINTLKTQKK